MLTNLTLTQMREGLESKKFSSHDLVSAHFKLIEQTKDLNSFIELAHDHAMQQAKLADAKIAKNEKAPLLGIPVAIKDMICTKNLRTTCASKILSNFVPPYDATVVTKLQNAGAIVVGKTNMDEFAMGSSNENSAFGPVLNPWDKSRVPGGSSGGSAVAVAVGQAPASLGTDTGGSIRQPASLCGIVGIKPTYGRVSRYGVVAYASSLDQVGPFARNVRDTAIITKIISGKDPHDSTSMELSVPDFEANLGKDIKGLRIGLPKEYFIKGLDGEVEAAVKKAVKQFEQLGAKVVEISLPHTEVALSVYYILAPAEASSNLARYDGIKYGYRAKDTKNLQDLYARTRSEGFGSEVKRRIMVGSYVLSTGYYDAFYLKAQKVRQLLAKDFKDAFSQHCDLIACPTAPTTAFKINEKVDDPLSMYLSDVFTIPVNLAGLPGLSLPCGFDSKGLPIGLQLIGKAFDEETIFKAAYAYEQANDWSKKLPVGGA